MKFETFVASLRDSHPPAEISSYLIALWHEKQGNWKTAHELVQEINTANAAWVHAYLHRKEGDEGNARYWYQNASKPFPTGLSLDEEWESLVQSLLASETL